MGVPCELGNGIETLKGILLVKCIPNLLTKCDQSLSLSLLKILAGVETQLDDLDGLYTRATAEQEVCESLNRVLLTSGESLFICMFE